LEEVGRNFDVGKPDASIPLLMKMYSELSRLKDDYWVDLKRHEIEDVIQGCAGLWLDALASDYSVVPGSQLKVTASAINRSNVLATLDSVSLPFSTGSYLNQSLKENVQVQAALTSALPNDFPYTTPYWLREPAEKGAYSINDQSIIGLAENKPPLIATFYVSVLGQQLSYQVPVRYRWVDPVDGEQYRPLEIIPPVALDLQEKVYVFSNETEKDITLTLKGGTPNLGGTVRLQLPPGWTSKPASIPFELKDKNSEKIVSFSVRASKSAANGNFSAEANIAGKIVTQGMVTIQYRHIPPQTMFPAAVGKLIRVDMSRNGKTVGYIMGAGDEIPTALRQMGYQVTLLTDDDLANRDFSKVDVVIAGVRAYNTRPALRVFQSRLMDYVKNGGTYIVQYTTMQRPESENLGPFPFNVSRDRVTVEEAPVVFLNPGHPLLNYPNKITADDFKGWIQERGLYFADKWDARYDTVIASGDAGENLKSGGLLYAKYGKGNYLYTGYAFFRQLPAGVPGAYRLFSNMLSVGKKQGDMKRLSGVEKTN
jgi:hypothetical protein